MRSGDQSWRRLLILGKARGQGKLPTGARYGQALDGSAVDVDFDDFGFFGRHEAAAFEDGAFGDGQLRRVEIAENLRFGQQLERFGRVDVAGDLSADDDAPGGNVAVDLSL